jgi:MYXO-CTERM domain-containing protein
MLTFGATFGDFGRALQQAADDLLTDGVIDSSERQLVDDTIEARGLHECDQVVPLRKEEPRTATLFGLDILAQVFESSCVQVKGFGAELPSFFQFRVTPDAGDEALRFRVDMAPQNGGELSWKIYGRADDAVIFQSGMFLPEVAEFDYVSEPFTATEGEMVIDELSNPPFDPEATYTFVIVHQNCPVSIATLSTDAPVPMAGTGGAGGAGTGGEGGAGGGNDAGGQVIQDGCGCHLAGDAPDSSWPAWLALGLGLAVRRRRRRRSRAA